MKRVLPLLLALCLTRCGEPPSPSADRPSTTPKSDASEPAEEVALNSIEQELVPAHEDRTFNAPYRDEYDKFDAKADGWDTEVFERDASAQLKLLFSNGQDLTHIADIVHPQGSVGSLRPELREVFRDASIAAWRGRKPDESDLQSGHAAFVSALTALHAPFDNPSNLQIKTKVITVAVSSSDPDRIETEVLYEGSGLVKSKRRQQNATWRLQWKRPSASEPPQIIHWIVDSHEEAASVGADATLFVEITESVLGTDPAWQNHLVYGVDHWRRKLERTVSPGITANTGIALGDLNGDGLDDVVLCQPLSLPNRVLIHQEDGTVKDVAAETGLDSLDPTSSALILDLDNDGDQDLITGGDGGAVVYENQGNLTFASRARIPFSSVVDSMAAADFDNDSLIDFYVCGHTAAGAEQSESVLGVPLPVYDAENGQPNMLIRNIGGWKFEDVTERAGLDKNNSRFTYAAAWEDFDNDGDQDLYVANDFGRNNLYRNDSGIFQDVAPDTGTEDISSGMSVSWADYNRDGWMDVYVGNMFSSAGNRVAYQRKFREGADENELGSIRRMARGNSLFENRGPNGFADVSVESGLTMGRWAWASKFVDFNNDGWEDVAIVNGFVSNQAEDDL